MSGEAVADRLVNSPGPRGWVLGTVLVMEALVAPLVFVVINFMSLVSAREVIGKYF